MRLDPQQSGHGARPLSGRVTHQLPTRPHQLHTVLKGQRPCGKNQRRILADAVPGNGIGPTRQTACRQLQAATLAVNRAGCAFSVSFSASSGPSKAERRQIESKQRIGLLEERLRLRKAVIKRLSHPDFLRPM